MLDQRFVRNNLDTVKQAVANKNERIDVDKFINLDTQRRELLQTSESLKQQRNTVSDEVAHLKRIGEDTSAQIEAMREVGTRIKGIDTELAEINDLLQDLLARLPNIPHPSVPVGVDDSANVEVRRWGSTSDVNFERKAHWDISEALDIIDFQRAGKISGSHFVLFKGNGARLQRALIQFMLDLHIQKHGYTEIIPPYLSLIHISEPTRPY